MRRHKVDGYLNYEVSDYAEKTVIVRRRPVAQPGFGGGGHRGYGERKSPSGVQGQSPWWVVRGGHSLRKLIAVVKDIWLPNHAQFCAARNFLVNPISGCTTEDGQIMRTRVIYTPCLHKQLYYRSMMNVFYIKLSAQGSNLLNTLQNYAA